MPTTEVIDYKELTRYRARLIPSRMIDHRLSRIERLVSMLMLTMKPMEPTARLQPQVVKISRFEKFNGGCMHRLSAVLTAPFLLPAAIRTALYTAQAPILKALIV